MLPAPLAVISLLSCCLAADAPQVTDAQKADLGRYFGFGPLQMYKLQPGINNLKLADLNGDGRTDIILWNRRKSRLEIFYQPDPGQATASASAADLDRNEIPNRGNLRNETIPVAYNIASLEIADVTGDKRPDIIFFGEPKEVVILPGKEGGGFGAADGIRAPEGNPQAGALAVGDFNSDGRMDVALLGGDQIQVYHQKPDGGLAKPIRLVHSIKQPLLMLATDLNGDGRDDLIVTADEDQYGVYAYLQEADGSLGALRRVKVPKLRSMTVAKPIPAGPERGDDLFAVEFATGRLKHYRWDTPVELGVAEDWPQRIYSYPLKSSGKRRPVAVGDVTGDGVADCVAADPDAAQLILFQGTGERLAAGKAFPGLVKTTDVCIADIDGDGRTEVLSVSPDEKMIGVSRFEDGRLTFPTPLAVRGVPQVVAVGALQTGQKPDHFAYVTRVDRELRLIVAPAKGGEGVAVPVEDLEDDPSAVRFADVNQDGRNDLLLFVRSGPVQTFLQKDDGTFELLKGADTRAGLVKEASIEAFDLADVTGDGKPEVLLAQKNLARALVVNDGRWTVVDQYNPETVDAQITGLTALPDTPGSPIITMYERKARELLVLKRRDDGAYAVVQSMPVGNFDLTAMQALPLGKDGAATALLLADAEKLALFTPGERAPTLVELHSYESKEKDAWLADAVVGDLNHDGVRDLAVVDMAKASLEIATTLPDGSFARALRFQVFQGKRFADAPDSRGEPREVLIGDVTGDKIDDIVLITHDRVIVYPGQ